MRSEYWYTRYKAIALLAQHGLPQSLSLDQELTLTELTTDPQNVVRAEARDLLERWSTQEKGNAKTNTFIVNYQWG